MNVFELLPQEFFSKEGNCQLSNVKENDIIGLYFSAHWCPPCRGFTPVLKGFYEEAKKNGKKIEIIFVSSDRDFDQFFEYYGEMPWIAIDFEGETREMIGEAYGIQGIPTLLIFNKEGNMIDPNGRATVSSKGQAAFDDWIKQE